MAVGRWCSRGLLTAAIVLVGMLAVVPDALAAPEAPATEAASSVTSSSAVLNGVVNPNVSALVGWYFAYSNGSECTGAFATGFGGEEEVQAKHVSGQAEGLEPDRAYRFCLVAYNSSGETTVGRQLSFTTAAVKPSVDAQSSLNVTSDDARLEAQINPNNQQTTYRFQYATDKTLENPVTVAGQEPLAASFADQGVSVDLGGALSPDTLYYYRVIAENASGATEGPIQTFQTTAPPLLTIAKAQDVVRAAATISGTLDPAGLQSTYYFQYGTTSAYGQNAPSVRGSTLPGSFGPLGVSIRLGGLVPATLYHYRLIASNADGTTTSPDETFTTGPPTPPTVTPGSASDITLTTALLTSQIDPRGLESSYIVELGTDTTYGTSIAGEAGASSENVTISVPIIELAPGSTYHYRFVAVNPDGRVYGPDQTFSTPAYEHPIVLPSVEPLLSVPAIASPSLAEEATAPRQNHKVARRRRKARHNRKAAHSKRAGKRKAGKSLKK